MFDLKEIQVKKTDKLNVLLTFGGRSLEHDVSLISASNILPHFNPEKYHVELLHISRDGHWLLCDTAQFKRACDVPEDIAGSITGVPVMLPIGQGDRPCLYTKETGQCIPIDVVFTVLHGKNGAGGIMKGLWLTAQIPAAGPSLLGGAVGFDKDVMKRLLCQAGLPVCRYTVIHHQDYTPRCLDNLKEQFSFPFFIKPANSGSSLGVHKIYQESDFQAAVQDVFSFDEKLIVEEYIDGSELEIYAFQSGNEIKTSIVRQTFVGKAHDFYTYEAKYGTDNATSNIKKIPADIPPEDHEKVKQLAIEAYRVLEGRGEVRLDLFYSCQKKIYVNEINTVPALMSKKSQPSLWEGCGISQADIVDALITAALKEAQALHSMAPQIHQKGRNQNQSLNVKETSI